MWTTSDEKAAKSGVCCLTMRRWNIVLSDGS